MNRVSRHTVTADVRTYGSHNPIVARSFDLMLGDGTGEQKRREALRILQQLGYQTRGVSVSEYPIYGGPQ